jgi:hypothetical protein
MEEVLTDLSEGRYKRVMIAKEEEGKTQLKNMS